MAKLLSFSDESRGALEKGVNNLANALKVTIGPKGRNVVIEKKFGAPDIVNDGVTIAKEIDLDDPFENIGAKLIEQVASKTKVKIICKSVFVFISFYSISNIFNYNFFFRIENLVHCIFICKFF